MSKLAKPRLGEMIHLMMNIIICKDIPRGQENIAQFLKQHGYIQRDQGNNWEPTPKAYRSSNARKRR